MSVMRHRVPAVSSLSEAQTNAPPTPLCPGCSESMVLSHKFYAQRGGPRMWHFHCIACKVGFTVAEPEEDRAR
jgi:hypothetical protein